MNAVDHPAHYGGDTMYEAIKVIEAWGLGFALGNAVKYISRAGKKGDALKDLQKARWYIEREIARLDNARQSEAPSKAAQPALRVGARVRVKQGSRDDLPSVFIDERGEILQMGNADDQWIVLLDGRTARTRFFDDELEVIA